MADLRRLLSLCTGLALVWAAGVPAYAQTRGTIVGTVTDPTGAKMTAVTIVITSPTGIDRRGASGVDGTYTFGGLTPGEYRMRVDDERFAPWSQEKIAVAAGERKTIDIGLQPRVRAGQPASMAGTVLGPNGDPLAGATLLLNGPGGEKRVTSGAGGAFTFTGLAAGSYRVTVAQPNALPYSSGDVAIAAGESRLLDVRLQPIPPPPPPPPPPTEPAAAGGAPSRDAPKAPKAPNVPDDAPPPVPEALKGLEPRTDRWRLGAPDYRRYSPPQGQPFVPGSGPLDPYNQNQFKGDFPLGNSHTFLNLNLQFNSQLNPVNVGDGTVNALNQNHVAGVEIFGGDAAFEPKRWAARVTTVANINKADLGGDAPFGKTFTFEELFGEKRLAVLDPEFDFVTVRGGMQNFNSDFRGFMYVDNELGVRLFGNAKAQRHVYNAAFFSMRERKGAFHDISKTLCPRIPGAERDDLQCGQNVIVGNYFFAANGADTYTAMVNVHFNQDSRETLAGIGKQSVAYVGFHGDGHWGGLAVSHAFYQAFGTDEDGDLGARLISNSSRKVNAQMAAIEISRDSDSRRYRGQFFYASGDAGDNADKASGFDAIQDNPNFAGGQFQFWTQQAIAVPGVGLIKAKFTLLPSLRNKVTERSNFLNPGLLLFGGGVDLRMSPSLKIVTNASMLRFAKVEILNALAGSELFTDANIGFDGSVGFKWRPFVNENLFVVGGFALLKPMGGFANALGRTSPLTSAFATFQIAF
jgi:hypothetical protein